MNFEILEISRTSDDDDDDIIMMRFLACVFLNSEDTIVSFQILDFEFWKF